MITKKELAEKVGVSRTTVSLVLNRNPNARISDKTRQRVLDAAKKYGYRSEEQTGVRLICYILCDRIDSPRYYESLRRLEEEVFLNNFRVIFLGVSHSVKDYEKMEDILRTAGVSGAVVAGDFNEEIIRRIQKIRIPFVAIGVSEIEGINLIQPDHFQSGFDATNYLLELGHRRIAFFTGDFKKYTHTQIFKGYKKAYEESGLTYDPALVQVSPKEQGHELVRRMKFLEIDYSAVLSVNQIIGINALNELKAEGRAIPNDVSVIAIGGGNASLQCSPKLTVMGGVEKGKPTPQVTIDLLKKQIEEENREPETIIYRNKLIVRESTGPYKG